MRVNQPLFYVRAQIIEGRQENDSHQTITGGNSLRFIKADFLPVLYHGNRLLLKEEDNLYYESCLK